MTRSASFKISSNARFLRGGFLLYGSEIGGKVLQTGLSDPPKFIFQEQNNFLIYNLNKTFMCIGGKKYFYGLI